MASCTTSQWVDYAPRAKLTVTLDESASDGDTAVLDWKLQYIASYPANVTDKRAWTVYINGSAVASGSYAIDGKTGTYTVASSESSNYNPISIAKSTSAKTISFKVSFAFNITWSGVYGGTKTASGSISIPAKTSYTITYNANGGSGAPSKQTKWYGTTLKLSTTKPTRTGYTFQGWGTSTSDTTVDYAAGANYTANASDTLYAIWKAITYTVTYNANGGSGAPSNQTKTYGTTLTLSSTKPTRTGYTFKGWGTSASATTVSYASGASYTKNAAITLYAIWETSYRLPRVTNVSVKRCADDAGTVNANGTYALVSFKWACDGSSPSAKIEWKPASSSAYSNSETVTLSGSSGTSSTVIGGGALSIESSYDILITVLDSGTTKGTTKAKTLSSMMFTVDYLNGGNGVAFGKAAELDGVMDVNFNQRWRKSVVMDNYMQITGVRPDGSTANAFQPQNENGNTVIGYGNYDSKSGNTNVYGHDVFIGISNIADPGYYRPYRRQGDTMTFNIVRTAGYVTNAGKDVSFWIPLAVPIVGSPTITASSVDGFTLRQGEKYTHGSSANTATLPDSYSVYRTQFAGVWVTAHFTDTTNVTNNDAIGITWSGTLTFT